MKLYVIGPVTGRENLNRKAFEDAKERLCDAGYDVLIPHDVVPPDATHQQAMRLSIKAMLGCDGVVVLSDWEVSNGAKLERDVAIACGLHVHNFLIWMNRASSWAHRSPDYSDGENSPEEAQNTAPSNDALSALTCRMDETNTLLRAACGQISVLIALMGMHMLNKGNFSERLLTEALEKAVQLSEEAGVSYRKSDGEENQYGRA